jgi:hypothetical protein
MSWASRRRISYLTGTTLFFLLILGGPLAWWYFTIPPTCTDGIQNQGETGVDVGGPCPILDPNALQSESIVWARGFRVRDGRYNAIAYIQNPNDNAGVANVRYRFGLYDADNVLVAERTGSMFLMPGAVTPVLESRIDTGNRIVAHTYFNLTSTLVWQRLQNVARNISINNKNLTDPTGSPRLTATATNTSVDDMYNVQFTAVVFDPAGNAFAASGTIIPKLLAGETQDITFTWPDPFLVQPGRIDIVAVLKPIPPKPAR